MAGQKVLRFTCLILSGIWLTGCLSYTLSSDDPLFPGYHRGESSQGITTAIIDREAQIPTTAPISPLTNITPEEPAAPESGNYSYPNWYRDRYINEEALNINLSYHLYGPYYYRDFRTRDWLNYQRRWDRLPWYADGWWFDELWWDHHFWLGWDYDPWYGYYYDPLYYHPYSYYQPAYGYTRFGGGYWYPWYGSTYAVSSVQARATERRPVNRRDLPTGLDTSQGSGISQLVNAQAGLSSSGATSTSTAKETDGRTSENNQTAPAIQVRPTQRQGNYTPSRSSNSSSSRSSAATKSTSSSSSQKSSSTTARPRGRKP
ncbi:hypothetical protein ACFL4K_00750 [Candidatus Neomarinimicrobiota bacterium]